MEPTPTPQSQSRQIRVFISSTFRDMQAERDHLVKFTFPALRKLCESRGVVWTEVDLRWGVTDEEAAEGKVLPICLEEIKRCRPYFIGLLGERYGWVPQSIPDELIERELWLKEQMLGYKSVTEMEILYGVLNHRDMAQHAFFYLRDPAYLDKLPPEAKRDDFTTEDAESTGKLQQLKQQIRASGFPVHENYADPKALGELVLADLTKVIDELYPEGSQPDPRDRETADHEAFAQSRRGVYIERDEYFHKLDAHAAGTGDKPLVILGESGSGKSALLANWALKYRERSEAKDSSFLLPPSSFLLLHFIGGTSYSSDWAAMLRRIMGEFKRRFGITQDIPDQPDALRAAFPNWLHMAAAKGRIILILDALNQLEDRDGAPDLVWLPSFMPENVRLLVSTLPGRAQDEVKKRGWLVLHVQALEPAERQQFITDYLAQYSKTLSQTRAARIAGAPQSDNPLYLRALLEELRLFGEHERLDERITHYLQAGTVPELYEKILARWEADYAGGTNLVRDAMTLLWAARRGLTEAELLYALGKDGEPLPRARWSPLFLATGDSLVTRNGLLTFFHDYLREAVRSAYLSTEDEQRAAHVRLADYFASQSARPRQVDELPWQLVSAAEWDRLEHLLTDKAFLRDAWIAAENDVKTYWAQLESRSSHRILESYRNEIDHPDAKANPTHVSIIAVLLANSGATALSLHLQEALVHHFRETEELNFLQTALGNAAMILRDQGKLAVAASLMEEREQLCRLSGNNAGLQACLYERAQILKFQGDLQDAMKLLREQENMCRQEDDGNGIATSLASQAVIVMSWGDFGRAQELLTQSERLFRQTGDLHGLQACLGAQAVVHRSLQEPEQAMAMLRSQESLCRQLGNLEGLMVALGNQALLLKDRGDLDGAMSLHNEEEKICLKLNKPDSLAVSLGNQANILYVKRDLDGALELQNRKAEICRKLGKLDSLAVCLGAQAVIHAETQDWGQARALHKEEEQIARKLRLNEILATSLINQAMDSVYAGQIEEAFALATEAKEISQAGGFPQLAHKAELAETAIGVVLRSGKELE